MKARIPRRRRCDARVKWRRRKLEQYERHGHADRAEVLHTLRASDRCRNWAIFPSRRCRLHGAFSPGARTAEGKQRQAEGRRRWLERLRAQGKKPGPAKGTGGRPRGSYNPSPETKAQRQLAQAVMRRARIRSLLGHATSASLEYRRKRREARQKAKREVQRLLEEHQKLRRELRLPPLSGEALRAVIRGFRQRVAVSVPFDPTPRWANVCELEDKVRNAEDTLERAKADAARADREARISSTMDAIDHAQGPATFPFERAERIKSG